MNPYKCNVSKIKAYHGWVYCLFLKWWGGGGYKNKLCKNWNRSNNTRKFWEKLLKQFALIFGTKIIGLCTWPISLLGGGPSFREEIIDQFLFPFILSQDINITTEYDTDRTIKWLTEAPRKRQDTCYSVFCIQC